MEYIKKEELIEGEIYTHKNGNIFRCDQINNATIYGKYINITYNVFRKPPENTGNFRINKIRLATPEEKHWLNCCITADKFITFEEAMKTFIPEYVECIVSVNNSFTENKIYKIENFDNNRNFNILDNDNYLRGVIMTGGLWSFKPSTKEAYDAQFVVIEPLPQFKVIETIETITKVENNEGNQFFIGDVVISDSGFVQTIKSFRYNVNKDNVLATTNVCNQISIARLEHYIEPKVEETLLEKAKRLYPVGTKVKTVCFGRVTTIKTDIFHETNHDLDKVIYADNGSISIYSEKENHWATIIE